MGTLIGRDGELARLERLLDERGALTVRGPRGCGVTALLDAAMGRAAQRGVPVLRAAGVEAESGFPYASLHQLLRPLRREVAELGGAPGEALRASFGLSDIGTPDPASVAAALVALAGAAGNGFVCVDDWQWVDAESRAAIGAFVARDVGVPVLLGGHAAGPDGVEELPVRPLDPVAAATMLGADLPLLVRERILREAAGRPLALRELPVAYAGAGDGELLGSWAPLTPVLEAAFADGLERLDENCARAVLVAALDDGGGVRAVVAAASRLTGRELSVDVLAPAIALGFVALDSDRVVFTHPLTRAAVRRAASPAAQAAGHEAFACAVAATDPDRATWHRVVGSSGLDTHLAAELEAASWRARDAGDHERAAAGLRRAANLTPAGADRSRRLVAAAELAYEIGGIDVGDRLLDDVVPEALDATGHARLLLLRPRVSPEALAAAAQTTTDADLALRLHWRAATKLQILGGDGATIARAARRSDRAGGAPGEAWPGVVSVGADGRPGERTAPRDVDAVDPVALSLRGYLAHMEGDDRLACRLLDAAVDELRAQRRRTRLAQVLALSARAQLGASALDRAKADGEEAVRLCTELRQPLWGALARTALAGVAALRGDEEAVERHAVDAERFALRLRTVLVLALVQGARGALALGAGRPAEAFAQLLRPFDPTDPAFDPGTAASLLGDLAEAASSDDERETVRRLLATTPEEPRSALARAHAAFVLAPDDDADGAFAVARRTITPDVPYAHARMLLVHGMRLRRRRRVADSREPLRAAAAGFADLGATPWVERAQRELAATAETAHRSEDAVDRLTPQELEIARMAARGMTNRAIAADLTVSPRTVSHHLAKIFPKLDVSSRAGVGAALERLGY